MIPYLFYFHQKFLHVPQTLLGDSLYFWTLIENIIIKKERIK